MNNTIGRTLNNSIPPSFKHKVAFDIGASQPDGSLKVRVFSEKGNELLYLSDSLNAKFQLNKRDKYLDKDEFVDALTDAFIRTEEEVIKIINENSKKFGKNEKIVTGFVALVPGLINNNTITQMTNIKTKEGESLQDIKGDDIKRLIRDKVGLRGKDDITFGKDFNVKLFQDLTGGAVYLIKKISEFRKRILSEGDYIVMVVTGGGFGSMEVNAFDNNKAIITVNSTNFGGIRGGLSNREWLKTIIHKFDQDYLVAEIDNLSDDQIKEMVEKIKGQDKSNLGQIVQSLSQHGASVKSFIKNYCDAGSSGYHKYVLQEIGDARLITLSEGEEIEISRKTAELLEKSYFKPFGLFEIAQIGEGFKLMLNTNPTDNSFLCALKKAHFQQCKSSIEKYVEAITELAFIKISNGANLMVVAGPLASGIDAFVRKNPALFEIKGGKGDINLRNLVLDGIN